MLGRRYSQILALYLLVQGIQGLFSHTTFWIFTTNALHGWVEIVLALAGFFWAPREPNTSRWLLGMGVILITAGALRLIPGTDTLLIKLFNANINIAIFNVIAGVATLGVGLNDHRNALSPADLAMVKRSRM